MLALSWRLHALKWRDRARDSVLPRFCLETEDARWGIFRLRWMWKPRCEMRLFKTTSFDKRTVAEISF